MLHYGYLQPCETQLPNLVWLERGSIEGRFGGSKRRSGTDLRLSSTWLIGLWEEISPPPKCADNAYTPSWNITRQFKYSTPPLIQPNITNAISALALPPPKYSRAHRAFCALENTAPAPFQLCCFYNYHPLLVEADWRLWWWRLSRFLSKK